MKKRRRSEGLWRYFPLILNVAQNVAIVMGFPHTRIKA
jgi:hypothetical protein